MRWKTVSVIFFLVVIYLIVGALVFRALEQPHESQQKLAILAEKLDFLSLHACVNSSELEDLVKVGPDSTSCPQSFITKVIVRKTPDYFLAKMPLADVLVFTYSNER